MVAGMDETTALTDARRLTRLGRLDEARRRLADLYNRAGEDGFGRLVRAGWLRAMAELSLAGGDPGGAKRFTDMALTYDPTGAEALRLAIQAGHGDDAAAMARALAVVENGPGPARPSLRPTGPRVPRLAVFVADLPRAREGKLARGLRAQGWRVVLLHRLEPQIDLAECFDEWHCYDSPWQAPQLAAAFRPQVFHCFALMNYATAAALLAHGIGPLVIDSYDQLAGCIPPGRMARQAIAPEHLALERWVFETADGHCCRGLLLQIAKRAMSITAPTLFFPDYCWDLPVAAGKLSAVDGQPHLGWGGYVLAETVHGAGEGYLDLIRRITSHGIHCHFHVINGMGNPNADNELRDYRRLAADNPLFHLEPPLVGHDWIQALARYDLGLHVFPQRLLGRDGTSHTGRYADLGFANKVMDYLDAGLPCLGEARPLPNWLARRIGFGIALGPGDLDDPDFWRALGRRVLDRDRRPDLETLRRRWSAAEQAPRLIRLYQRVAAATCADEP